MIQNLYIILSITHHFFNLNHITKIITIITILLSIVLNLEEAFEVIDSMLVKGVFGSAGCQMIVEEFLEGEEAFFFCTCGWRKRHSSRICSGPQAGLRWRYRSYTGGMGAYSPAHVLTKELQDVVMDSIIHPTVKRMAEEGCKFVGVLFAGLMIEKKSSLPMLIEFNVRFGDPEYQVLMMRLESDLAKVLLAACRSELSGVSLDWSNDSAMVVVMASKGYPGDYEKETIIKNLEEAETVVPGVKVFHAGTNLDSDENVVAIGGRVLGVTTKGKDLEEARE